MKIRSLATKFVALALAACIIPVAIVAIISVLQSMDALTNTLGEELMNKSFMVGNEIDSYFEQRIADISMLSQANVLEAENADEKRQYFDEVLEANPNLTHIFVFSSEGVVIASSGSQDIIGTSMSQINTSAFALVSDIVKSSQGDVFLTDAVRQSGQEHLSVFLLTPITDDSNIKVVGILVVEVSMKSVEEMIAAFDDSVIGDKSVYLLNDDGEVIVTGDGQQEILVKFNDLKVNKNVLDATDEDGSKAYVFYKDFYGDDVMAGMADMEAHGKNDALDWGIIAMSEMDAIAAPAYALRNMILVVALICIAIVAIVTIMFSNSIKRPLRMLVETVTIIEKENDYSVRVKVNSEDEIGQVAIALNSFLESMQKAVNEINMIMGNVSKGDFQQNLAEGQTGELKKLVTGINKSIELLSSTMFQVVSASEQVNLGASQISSSSQALASGTSEQAASLEEISSSMSEVGSRASDNTDNANQAAQLTNQAMDVANRGNAQMKDMLQSMDKINGSSADISKIIKVIDEIAFQTNLLALNAAVEAARAGKYGKGFAVVAEEVRNLAARSAEAAKNTTELIENSVKEVESGVSNAGKTAEVLNEISSSITRVNDLVGEIASASQEQSNNTEEINKSLTQVNSVVQQNSSISEEAASASEELGSQSMELQNLMSRFKLQQSGTIQGPAPVRQSAIEPIRPEEQTGKAQKMITLDDDNFGKY